MNSLNLQNTAYCLISIFLIGYMLIVGSSIIIPIIFAIILSVFLNPIESKIRSKIKIKWLSITLSFLVIILPLLFITTFFSIQFLNIFESLPSIGEKIQLGFEKISNRIYNIIPGITIEPNEIINDQEKDLKGPLKILGQGLLSTTTILTSSGLVFIYAFLLLYYKLSFKNFIIYTFEKSNRSEVKEIISEILKTIQAYIAGLGIVVLLLTILNTIGLTIIGIEYAYFWGAMAGCLAIIPYIGTTLGGLFPFLFAFSTTDTTWQPIAVIIYYLIIQQIEGNFITPKIVGNKVDVNPLFAILSLLIFGSIWGVAGIILALPLISIAKIILSQFDKTKAIAVLMSSDLSSKKTEFKKIADN